MTWLGSSNGINETFPEHNSLNEAQIRTLVGFSQIRVASLGVKPALRKLTESGIIEVSVNWSKTINDFGAAGMIWLADDGEYIAAAVWDGAHYSHEGPIMTYRWMPKSTRWRLTDRAHQQSFRRARGRDGAYEDIRRFIKEQWVEVTATVTE